MKTSIHSFRILIAACVLSYASGAIGIAHAQTASSGNTPSFQGSGNAFTQDASLNGSSQQTQTDQSQPSLYLGNSGSQSTTIGSQPAGNYTFAPSSGTTDTSSTNQPSSLYLGNSGTQSTTISSQPGNNYNFLPTAQTSTAGNTTSAAGYTALAPLPCVPGGSVTCSTPGALQTTFDFKTYVQYVFNLVIALSAAAAVFMIVFGGLQYMTTDSWTGKSDGRKKATDALLGLVLVLTSYMILRTVDPRLVDLPTTLVAPLPLVQNAISASTADMNAFFNQLTAEAANYHLDMTAFTQNIADAKARIDAAGNDVENIESQIAAATGQSDIDAACGSTQDAQIKALCDARQADLVIMRTASQTVAFNVAEGSMRAVLQQCGQTGGQACVDNQAVQSNVQNILDKYYYQLNPQQQQQLLSYTGYIRSVDYINQRITAIQSAQTAATNVGVATTIIGGVANGVGGLITSGVNSTITSKVLPAYKVQIEVDAINAQVTSFQATPNADPGLVQMLSNYAAQAIKQIKG